MSVGLEQYAVTASAGHTWPSGIAVRGFAGAVVDGTLTDGRTTFALGPGYLGGVAASRPWPIGSLFLIGTASLGASHTAAADSDRVTAIDARVGAIVGRRFGPVAPYLLARAFGGPVMWGQFTGGDATHVQLGAGATLTYARLSLLLDLSAIGERSASLGVSYRL